jgi:tripartite ATP-independent transporter DctM subunit
LVFLLVAGGFLRRGPGAAAAPAARPDFAAALRAVWDAKWEILAPLVAIGSLVSGLATPTESAALTAAYAVLTQALAHRELDWQRLGKCLADCTQVIGGVMLILGMALGLTNYLVDAGIPDLAVEWVQRVIPDRLVFLLALCAFLFVAGALMEIFAAIVVLVPLLLPVAKSYGIDPVHFGILMAVNMEVGLCHPPVGLNLYVASGITKMGITELTIAVWPWLLTMIGFLLVVTFWPTMSLWLPHLLFK